MVFRKESRSDSFQRQISQLRQQLGADAEGDDYYDDADDMPPLPATPPSVAAPVAAAPVTPSASFNSTSSVRAAPITQPAPMTQMPASDATTGIVSAGSTWDGKLH